MNAMHADLQRFFRHARKLSIERQQRLFEKVWKAVISAGDGGQHNQARCADKTFQQGSSVGLTVSLGLATVLKIADLVARYGAHMRIPNSAMGYSVPRSFSCCVVGDSRTHEAHRAPRVQLYS